VHQPTMVVLVPWKMTHTVMATMAVLKVVCSILGLN
jgi:hypothetical protein